MKRREFISLLGGVAAAWPLAARAQQPERVRRIAMLTGRAEDVESLGWVEAMRQRLMELGWSDGRNVRIDLRAGGGVERWQADAGELVASAPDVIVVVGNPGVAALRRETRTVPIVFVQVGDPSGSGFVASLARPGATSRVHAFRARDGGKWLEVLKESRPRLGALVLPLPEATATLNSNRAAQAAGPIYKVAVSSAGVHNAGDIERAVTAFAG
jgi:putative ABC transport system substrate-binding protein